MVWCDEIEQNAIWTDLANVNPNDYGTTCYDDTFILKKDGKIYAAGTNIGTEFLPIEVKKNMCRKAIRQKKSIPEKKKIQIEGTAAEGLAE